MTAHQSANVELSGHIRTLPEVMGQGSAESRGNNRWAKIRDYLHPEFFPNTAVTKKPVDGRESLDFRSQSRFPRTPPS
jgi:hypothetical protein